MPTTDFSEVNFSEKQKSVLIGGLLGDSYLAKTKKKTWNSSLKIDRQLKDYDYLFWQFKIFENVCSHKIYYRNYFNKVTNKTYQHCKFDTRSLPIFSLYRNIWYPEGTKIVPSNLELNSLIMAVWFCDDGSIQQTSFKKNKKFNMKFATHGFTSSEVEFLCLLLSNRYNITFRPYKDGSDLVINATTEACDRIIKDIDPVFPDGIERKRKWKYPE